MLFGHGVEKLIKLDQLRGSWHVPSLFPLSFLTPPMSLMLTIAAEIGAALLFIFGLSGRLAAFILSFTMVIIVFEVNANLPWIAGPNVPAARELSLLYLIGFSVIILCGSGRYSMDHLIVPENKRRGRITYR